MFPQRNIFRFSQRAAQQLRVAGQRRANSTQSNFPWAVDNAFNRERDAVKHHAAETSDLWRKLALYAVPPCLILAAINAYNLWEEHWEHWAHEPPLEERTEYPYQNIRVKNFPFGDGDKTIFWNSSVNYHNKDKPT
ncbi:cytochrome c oxidase subunit VIa [Aspergillus chevalieri]|uniref:Cytochrome c oxidase subunit 13, mitochondrial n=1 Tax=Aspergillus chevalieri TaxID=182096 RepID=A0A7R7ZSF3_ASPCH|nr:cytochrome c oxidase subunit 6A, mitochondrial [Aspergillus chevalieri]BCR91624.1 cytochrome c oxidase subunit 6A, mitochondrial [Aspergillus chevalieri]